MPRGLRKLYEYREMGISESKFPELVEMVTPPSPNASKL